MISSLPPELRDISWQRGAICVDYGPDFSELPVKKQKTWCDVCPVMTQCREFALALEPVSWAEDLGTWPVYGGLNAKERQKVIQERRREARLAQQAS